MAKKTWNNPIDKNVDWGGDASTENLPVSGEMVQKFIKDSLNGKAGVFYYDTANNRYIVFADVSTRDKYLDDPTRTDLIIGTFDAPFNYTAEINLATPTYNAVYLGDTGNYLDFTFDVKNKQGASTGENVVITYTFIRNASKKVSSQVARHGESIHFNVDKYLGEGSNTIIIGVTGQTSLAATTVSVTYNVVNLQLTDETDISIVYDISSEPKVMEVPFTIKGTGTKVVEWYLDGEFIEFVKSEDEVVDIEAQRVKYIQLANLQQGKHSLQIRAYTTINGERFYTKTLYRDIMVYTGANSNSIMAISMEIPAKYGLVENTPIIYGITQYIPYPLKFATYSPGNKTINVTVSIDTENVGFINSQNGIVNEFSIVSNTSGNKTIHLAGDEFSYEIPAIVAKTTMSIEEITSNLKIDFSAIGKNNNSSDKDLWQQGDYYGTFEGFEWNAGSGWTNNRLKMNAGASFGINYAPLADNPKALGRTLEFEFKTLNVNDDNAVICDLRNSAGTGILITATKVSVISENGIVVENEFKSNENVRISIVINRATGTSRKGLTLIYANGSISRGVNWAVDDNYTSDANILFKGSAGAEVELKSIRIYESALSDDNILNNYILYRDSVAEMLEVYDRNNVYAEGTTTFSPDKMVSRLPVMIVTGDIPTLENTSDKDTQIIVDIEYTNMQDTSRSFKMVGAAMRPQGTSSMGYPKKNFRIYTQKVANTILYDSKGKIVDDKLYSFKEGAIPVDCWCLKADYAESSGTHNTGIARMWNNALYNMQIDGQYVCRTEAQKAAIAAGYPYDVRTTIDGFPILLFYRKNATDEPIFIGKYNFNNDKSTEKVFGFTDIPGFDNSKMQCWEILNNGNPLALFQTIDGFDDGWKEAYESRYPDTKTPNTADLKAFSQWMVGVNGDHERFATEKWEHFKIYPMAAYYCYLMRHAAADQLVKNAMFTSEDGIKFYFIQYDNDTINGLINTGDIDILPTDDRQSVDESGEYKFAGHSSVLWNMLEADEEFMKIVRTVDNALYSAGISYNECVRIFDEEQADKWVERVYNQDSEYKYVGPYVNQGINNLFMLQGKRDLHRRWWLSKRFSIYDAKFVTGEYKSQAIELKCMNDTPIGQRFSIKAGYPLDYGFGINNLPRESGVTLAAGESHTFETTEVVNLGDPIRIYGAPNIEEVDLSPMANRLAVVTIANVYSEALGTRLKKLILGGDNVNNIEVPEISGLKQAKMLTHLDVRGMKGIKALDLTSQPYFEELKAVGSEVSSVSFAKGAPVNRLELPTTMKILNLEQLPYLTYNNIISEDNFTTLKKIEIKGCPKISNSFDWIHDWYSRKTYEDKECSLVMDNVDWDGVSGLQMFHIASLGNVSLKGKVVLTDITEQQGAAFVSVFGTSVFDPNSEFYIDAPMTLSLEGPIRILEGSENDYNARVYPPAEGTITYSLEQGRDGASIDSASGVLTIAETGEETSNIVVKATFAGDDGKLFSKSLSVEVLKRVYPEGLSISGSGNLKDNIQFVWHTTTASDSITGEYDVVWSASGDLASYCRLETMDDNCFVWLDTLPPTSMNGTLTVQIKRKSDGVVVSSASTALSYAYVYPASASMQGQNKLIGGELSEYFVVISPSNVDIGITYTWTISGSNNAVIESQSGNSCVVRTNPVSSEESFTLMCKVTSSDGKITIKPSKTVTIEDKPSYITAKYNVTSTASATQLLYSSYSGEVTYMQVDGVEVAPATSYMFGSVGEHIVKFTVSSLYGLFREIKTLVEVDFSECNGAKYTSIEEMFYGCSTLTNINFGNCRFSNAAATSLEYTFYNCKKLENLDLTPFVNALQLNYAFYCCESLKAIDLSPFMGRTLFEIEGAFSMCASLTSIDLSPIKEISGRYQKSVFSACRALKTVEFGDCTFTNNKLDISFLFNCCSSLTHIKMPKSSYNPSNYKSLFYGCTLLKTIDVNGRPLSGSLESVFYKCESLESIDSTIISSASSLKSTFSNCYALKSINFDGIRVSAKDLSNAFSDCSSLESLDLSALADVSVSSLDSTFSGCIALKTLVLPWSTAPAATNYTFGLGTMYYPYAGRNTYNTGENKLYVPAGATGYDTGYWLDTLQNATKCGFTLSATL